LEWEEWWTAKSAPVFHGCVLNTFLKTPWEGASSLTRRRRGGTVMEDRRITNSRNVPFTSILYGELDAKP